MRLIVSAIAVCVACSFSGTQLRAQDGLKPQTQAGAQKKSPGDGVKPRTAAQPATDAPAKETVPVFNQRALDLLRQTADETKKWTDLTIAAKTEAQIADLLWDADPIAARAYLTEAWSTTERIEEPSQARSRFRNYPKRAAARSEVLLVARKRASDLAEKWLLQMTAEAEEAGTGSPQARGLFDDRSSRSNVLLQMAMQSVKSHPEAASSLAAESLRDGISFGLQQVLVALQEQDADLAKKTFSLALMRLRTVGMSDPNELLVLYSYIYTPGMISTANTSNDRGSGQIAVGRNKPPISAMAEADPALAAEFLTIATKLLLNAPLPSTTADPQTTARAQMSVINYIRGKVERIAPQEAEALFQRLGALEVDARFSVTERAATGGNLAPIAGESREQYADRRVDELERRAKNSPSGLRRDVAYAEAALATEVERYERGMSLAGNIGDRKLRDDISGWLTYRAAFQFIGRENYDRAYTLIREIADSQQKAASLIIGAQKLVRAKNTARARQWLEEASRITRGEQEGGDELAALSLGVVTTYGQFDKQLALEELSSAVGILNQTQTTAVLTTGKAPEVRRFDGLTVPDFTQGTSGFGLQPAVNVFGREQFEAVLSVLQQIKRPELRGTAVVTLCLKHLRLATPSRK